MAKIEQQLEEAATKSAVLIERTVIELEPKVSNLLTAFTKWLDSKLEQPKILK